MGLKNINQIAQHVDNIYNENLIPLNKFIELRKSIRDHRLKVFQHIGTSGVKEMEELKKEMEQIDLEIDSRLKNEGVYKLRNKEGDYFKAIIANWNTLHESYKKILSLSEGFSKEDAFRLAMAETQNVQDAIGDNISRLHLSKEDFAKSNYEESMKVEKQSWITTMFITAVSIIVLFGISFLITGSIKRSINSAVSSLSSTSTEIASTVEQHERTAQSQSASVSETTTTMDELSVSTRRSAEQADAVTVISKQALSTTEDGIKMANQASAGMSNLKQKVGAIGEQILKLSEQTGQIGGIANMVTDIAGQINMLALNAAVEAVRAGESGKGFSVIAQEVRKLADQGKKSAEKVNTIVADIQKATNSAVMVTEAGTKTVEDVAQIAQRAGESFGSLSGIANSVYENAQQVSLNMKQQVAAIKQVTDAMGSINAGAKETSAGISQTKIGLQRLNEAAQELKKMV
ncbi:MAG TPA: chemotaxis protein [Nitrospinae bacterium]|nr:chemotaxis protein [Nitrospinota bacterium]